MHWLPKLALAGGGFAVIGLLIAFLLPGGLLTGLLGLFVLIVGMLLITPASIPLFHDLLRRLPLAGTWRLAVSDLNRHVSRLGTAAAALMLALAAAISVAIMVQSMRTAVSRYRSRSLELDTRPLTLIGTDLSLQAREGFRFVDVPAVEAWQAFDQGAVLISEPLASRLGKTAGDTLALPSPTGERDFPIGGVFRDFATEHGRLFMPWPAYTDAWRDDSVTTHGVFSDDLGPARLKQEILRLVSDEAQLLLTEAETVYQESMAVFERTFRITGVLRGLSLGVAIVGILSALMAIQLQRRKEFAMQRALGMIRRQLAGLIVAESLLLGAVAVLLSLPTGILMAWVLTEAVQFKAFGWTMPLSLEVAPQVLNIGLGLLAAALAALYPAWLASRADPAPQLRED